MKRNNCDNVNPDLRLTAGKHGNRMSAYGHIADTPTVCLYTETDERGVVRTRGVFCFKVSDADKRDN
jgi:hypothetical protein